MSMFATVTLPTVTTSSWILEMHLTKLVRSIRNSRTSGSSGNNEAIRSVGKKEHHSVMKHHIHKALIERSFPSTVFGCNVKIFVGGPPPCTKPCENLIIFWRIMILFNSVGSIVTTRITSQTHTRLRSSLLCYRIRRMSGLWYRTNAKFFRLHSNFLANTSFFGLTV